MPIMSYVTQIYTGVSLLSTLHSIIYNCIFAGIEVSLAFYQRSMDWLHKSSLLNKTPPRELERDSEALRITYS